MNFLGHLYFSGNHYPLMIANLFGDFVKGKDYSYLPKIVQDGVTLHRSIDDYIDHHPAVTKLRRKLYTDLPKVAGIAIDLYFDHLLAKNWQYYHAVLLADFVTSLFNYANRPENLTFENKFTYPKEFKHLLHIMYERDWLNKYTKIAGLQMASTGLSKRISFPNKLYQAPDVFVKHEEEITLVFRKYMDGACMKFNIQPNW